MHLHAAGQASIHRLVDHLAGVRGLLAAADGVLQDVALPPCRDARSMVCRQMEEAPQRAAAAGLPGTDSAEEVQPRSYGGWSPNGISGLTDPLSI
jgi:hypothetical protein